MKHLFSTLFLVATLISSAQLLVGQCSGDVVLTTQVQVDNFDCTTIGGNLTIESINDIEDLDPLFGLTSVEGDVIIKNNYNLVSLQGLDGITSIGGSLIIEGNNIQDLGQYNWQLTMILGDLLIKQTNQLTDFSRLIFLTQVVGSVTFDTQTLDGSDGFPELFRINGSLTIKDCSIDNFSFPALDDVLGDINITDNTASSPQDFSMFMNLEVVYGLLTIANNTQFTSMNNIENLIYANSNGGVVIENNEDLVEISGFNGLESATRIEISNNPQLQSIDGFSLITEVYGDLRIRNQPELSSLNGFANLEEVEGTLRISGNNSDGGGEAENRSQNGSVSTFALSGFNSLTTCYTLDILYNDIFSDISGFSMLEEIGSELYIQGNAELTQITGLENVETIFEELSIYANPDLSNVEGFQDLTYLKTLTITNNSSLSMCCWAIPIFSAEGLFNVTIEENATGCNSPAEVLDFGIDITCPDDITISTDIGLCTGTVFLTDPVPTANCSIESSYTLTLVYPDGNEQIFGTDPGVGYSYPGLPIGTTFFNYTVTDVLSNFVTCTTSVTIEDTELPTWVSGTTSLTVTGICGLDDVSTLLNDNTPVAIDNCGIQEVSYVETDLGVDCGSGVAIERTYSAVDINGNSSSDFILTIILEDSTAPTLSALPADITINCNDPYPSLPLVTAYDECEGDLSNFIDISDFYTTGDCTLGTAAEATMTVFTVVDGCGNLTNASWTVTVMNDFDIDLGSDIVICDDTNYTLIADEGLSYLWSTGETTQSISVSSSDNYEVTVTSFNGCCSIDDVNVTFGEGLTATAIGGMIDCTGSNVVLSGSSSSSGVSYMWSGPGGFTSTAQNPSVSMTGDYTLVVQDTNGCTASDVASVTPDTDVPDLGATGGIIDCNNPIATLTSISAEAVSFAWTGPGGFTSNIANPSVSEGGTYTILVTAANGCTNSTSVTVTEDVASPGVMVNEGTLTCAMTSVLITANSSNTITEYSWSGPNGYTSTVQSISVLESGTYTVIVTGSNGCTSTADAVVLEDIVAPGVSTSAEELNCNNSFATLMATSDEAIAYSWSGPSGFSAPVQNPTTSVSGLYTVVVTASNGCTATSTIEVLQDIAEPEVSAAGGELDCNVLSVILSATSDDASSSYQWSGPNAFNETGAQVSTDVAGSYQLVVTASNGCTASAISEVTSDTAAPSLALEVGGVDCASGTVSVMATTSGMASVSWTGPSGYTGTGTVVSVTEAGDYIATATTMSNGCTAIETISVSADLSTPSASAVGGELSCSSTSVQLIGMSDGKSVTYTWSGPGGYTSSLQNPTVEESGMYTLTVSNTSGCTSTAIAMVTTDPDLPTVMVEGNGIDCIINEAILIGSTSTMGATGSWSGPKGFSSTETSVAVTNGGLYTYTVVGDNGCEASASYEVSINVNPPSLELLLGEVDCGALTQELILSSEAMITSVQWTTPSGMVIEEGEILSALEDGTYTVEVTAANGCTSIETITVNLSEILPVFSVDWGTLDCNTPNTEIIVTSGSLEANFMWTGPSNFNDSGSQVSVEEPGEYQVTIELANGCVVTEVVEVVGNFTEPTVALSTGMISCADGTVDLQADTEENTSIVWSGPGGFTDSGSQVTVSQAGTYSVEVTSTVNGCSTVESIFVDQDFSIPSATASGGQLSCTLTSITLTGNSSSMGVSYAWIGPGGYMSTEQNPQVEEAGEYTLTVTSTNGCTNTATVTVTTDPTVPSVSITGENISCVNSIATLIGSTNTPNATILWEGPNGFSSGENAIEVTVGGVYMFTVTGQNGCSSTSSYEVTEDIQSPEFVIVTGSADCENGSQELILDSSDAIISIVWVSPDGTVSTDMTAQGTVNGSYTITATGSNGCQTTESVALMFAHNYQANINTTNASTSQAGAAILTIEDGIGDYTISWDNGEVGPTAINLEAGDHIVTVTDDNGCQQEFTFIIGLMSSIEDDLTSAELNVYPNPANELLQIETDLLDISQIVMYNQRGQVVLTHNIGDTKQLHTLDVSILEAGIYKVLIMSNSQRIYRTVFIVD